MLRTSVLATARSPPVNNPALSRVPEVLSIVLTAPEPNTMKTPFTVPEPVKVKVREALRALLPPEAEAHTHVFLFPPYVGAFPLPASVQPAWLAIVSLVLKPLYPTEEMRPIYGPVTVYPLPARNVSNARFLPTVTTVLGN